MTVQKKSPVRIWAKSREETFHQRGSTDGKSMKRCSTSLGKLGKCQLKPQGGGTTHIPGWPKEPKNETVTTPNAGEDSEKADHLYVAGGNVRWHSYSGKQFGNFFQN